MKKIALALAAVVVTVLAAYGAANLTYSFGNSNTPFSPTGPALFKGSDMNVIASQLNTIDNQLDGTTTMTPSFKFSTVAATGAGSAASDAAPITTGFVLVTAADGTKGVVLPTAPLAGTFIIVKNNSASALAVWPDAAATINAIAANDDIDLAANTAAIFIASSPTQWWTLPLLPS
jgi:hypothetical protein